MRVPALMLCREGSKRLPGKNRLDWNGKPLWLHAAEQTLAAESVTCLHIGTDMPDVHAARVRGVKPVHVWPIGTMEPFIECINEWRRLTELYATYVLLVQCTSPFINPADLDALVKRAFSGGCPQWVYALGSEKGTHPALANIGVSGTPSGMGYIIPPDAKTTLARVIVPQKAPMVDLDTVKDWEEAIALAHT